MKPVFNPNTNIIYLDMDGVLADFDAFCFSHMGRIFGHDAGPELDMEMWNFLVTVPRLYYVLKPTPYAKELVARAKVASKRVEVLTAIPRRVTIPEARQDKILWNAEHIDPLMKVNFGPYSADKWKHAKPGDVLVDDKLLNIHDWNTKGQGIGIYHDYSNPAETFKQLENLINSSHEYS